MNSELLRLWLGLSRLCSISRQFKVGERIIETQGSHFNSASNNILSLAAQELLVRIIKQKQVVGCWLMVIFVIILIKLNVWKNNCKRVVSVVDLQISILSYLCSNKKHSSADLKYNLGGNEVILQSHFPNKCTLFTVVKLNSHSFKAKFCARKANTPTLTQCILLSSHCITTVAVSMLPGRRTTPHVCCSLQ